MKKFWAVENISARAKTSKDFCEKFEKVVPCSVSGEKQNRNGQMPTVAAPLVLLQVKLLACEGECTVHLTDYEGDQMLIAIALSVLITP